MVAVNYVALAISMMGVAVLAWGALMAAIEFVSLEIKRFKGVNICSARDHLRHHLGSYILLGLEFSIAADIIRTIMQPTKNDLIILGSIVLIRTVLSYFLNLEMRVSHKCEEA